VQADIPNHRKLRRYSRAGVVSVAEAARCARGDGRGGSDRSSDAAGRAAGADLHPDSYGYRPGRMAHEALAVTGRRCWKFDWVLDIDVRAFFDSMPRDLLLKAVAHQTGQRWALLYIDTVAESLG
jgi:hypothetical protein